MSCCSKKLSFTLLIHLDYNFPFAFEGGYFFMNCYVCFCPTASKKTTSQGPALNSLSKVRKIIIVRKACFRQ